MSTDIERASDLTIAHDQTRFTDVQTETLLRHMGVKNAPPMRNVVARPQRTVGLRNNRRSTSGSFVRSCHQTNVPRPIAATTKSVTTGQSVHR